MSHLPIVSFEDFKKEHESRLVPIDQVRAGNELDALKILAEEYKAFRYEEFKASGYSDEAPYILSPFTFIDKKTKYPLDFLSLMKKYPPILSKKYTDKTVQSFSLTSPDLETPWLTFSREDPHYNWMFQRTFAPQGLTHYLTVNLEDLANSKAIEDVAQQ